MEDLQRITFGGRLSNVIRKRGQKLSDFAKESSIPYRTLQEYIYKGRLPGIKHLIRLDAVGIDVMWLLTGKPTVSLGIKPSFPTGNPFIGDKRCQDALMRKLVALADSFGLRRHERLGRVLSFTEYMTVMQEYYRLAIVALIAIDAVALRNDIHFRGLTADALADLVVTSLDESRDSEVEKCIAESPWRLG